MAQETGNSGAFIEAQQFSNFIYTNLRDGLLPTIFYRNVSDFGSGTTLNIKTVGDRTIQDLSENEAIDYTAIDSNTITLTITEFVGDGVFVTDVLREDGAQVDRLLMESAAASTRAIQEDFETKALAALNNGQTVDDPNNINGFAHRVASGETNDTITLDHLVEMKLAFDKANVPAGGRMLIVDPVAEATLNKLVTTTVSVDRNPEFKGVVMAGGFARDHTFVMNLFGWNIITSNRLPRLTVAETISAVAAPIGNIVNLFMSVADDNTKPLMLAWRRMPKTESGRNKDLGRDEFVTSARYGFGTARLDTLGSIITSPTATE